MKVFPQLKKIDPEIARLTKEEIRRQQETLNLIPSENLMSPAVLEALGTPFGNKYSEGYPGKRYYAGNEVIDKVESLARERARRVFRLGKNWHVNVQTLSGSPANMAVYFALLNPGDKIMGMSLPFGGHLTHGWRVSFSGKFYHAVHYAVGCDGLLDYDAIRRLAKKEKPKLIICGASAYPRIIDFEKFGKIAREVGAWLLADIAHIAGLIAGGSHPSPFPHADAVTTTTHKTLRGPRGALIFVNKNSVKAKREGMDIAAAIDKAVFPGLQGGPHNNQTAAIAVALKEALAPRFKKYAHGVVKNAKALARSLLDHKFTLISGGTDNHLMLVDVTALGLSGGEAERRLEEVGIIVNKNTIPYDARSPFDPSGIRLGSPALTSRGMKEKEMIMIAGLIADTLLERRRLSQIQKDVRLLCKKFPLPY